MKLFYVELHPLGRDPLDPELAEPQIQYGLIEANSIEHARAQLAAEAKRWHLIVSEADANDIEWMRSMGVKVPDLAA